MTLEQYIMKRKDEDGIDEFDKSKRSEVYMKSMTMN